MYEQATPDLVREAIRIGVIPKRELAIPVYQPLPLAKRSLPTTIWGRFKEWFK